MFPNDGITGVFMRPEINHEILAIKCNTFILYLVGGLNPSEKYESQLG